MDQPQGISIDVGELYALIGQLTVENRVLRVRLAAAGQQHAARNGAGPTEPVWREYAPSQAAPHAPETQNLKPETPV